MAPDVYAGAATRAVALACDAAIVNGSAVLVAAVAGLCMSLLNTSDAVDTVMLAIGGIVFVVWVIVYFVMFWSTTGQTPGSRLMRIRVGQASGEGPLPARRGCIRLVGMLIAAVPLMLGYAPILFDRRRRGLHDLLARSVVTYA